MSNHPSLSLSAGPSSRRPRTPAMPVTGQGRMQVVTAAVATVESRCCSAGSARAGTGATAAGRRRCALHGVVAATARASASPRPLPSRGRRRAARLRLCPVNVHVLPWSLLSSRENPGTSERKKTVLASSTGRHTQSSPWGAAVPGAGAPSGSRDTGTGTAAADKQTTKQQPPSAAGALGHADT